MGKYYDTFENQTDSLAFAHKGVVNGKCLDCHENTLGTSVRMAQSQLTGNHETPLAKVTYTNEFCLQSGCHAGAGIMPGASESSTKDLAFDPHSDFHGVQQCNSCHRMHDQSVFTCAGCHQVGAWEGEGGIPEVGPSRILATASRAPCRTAGPRRSCSRPPSNFGRLRFDRLRLSTKKGRAFGLALFLCGDCGPCAPGEVARVARRLRCRMGDRGATRGLPMDVCRLIHVKGGHP